MTAANSMSQRNGARVDLLTEGADGWSGFGVAGSDDIIEKLLTNRSVMRQASRLLLSRVTSEQHPGHCARRQAACDNFPGGADMHFINRQPLQV
jgi:hypothetical protein